MKTIRRSKKLSVALLIVLAFSMFTVVNCCIHDNVYADDGNMIWGKEVQVPKTSSQVKQDNIIPSDYTWRIRWYSPSSALIKIDGRYRNDTIHPGIPANSIMGSNYRDDYAWDQKQNVMFWTTTDKYRIRDMSLSVKNNTVILNYNTYCENDHENFWVYLNVLVDGKQQPQVEYAWKDYHDSDGAWDNVTVIDKGNNKNAYGTGKTIEELIRAGRMSISVDRIEMSW